MRAAFNPALAPRPVPVARRTPLPPLTHHEIFALVAPFTRQGLQVDLAASDRAERRLLFRPRRHAPGVDGGDATLPPLRETLELSAGVGAGAAHTLTRHLVALMGPLTDALTDALVDAPGAGPGPAARAADVQALPGAAGLPAPGATAHRADDPPLVATLQAQGEDLAALLQAVQAVPVAAQFRRGQGFLAAHSLRTAPDGTPYPVRGELRLDAAPGLRLVLRPPRVRGPSVEVELSDTAAALPALPDDLFAVLGRGWSPLTRWRQGWRGTLRVRGSAAQRQQRALQWLHTAGTHLARTLAEPPARYHARLRWARWAVVAWRALPVALGVAVCVAAWQVQVREIASESVLKVIANIAPPLMLLTFFAMPELPRVEIPPLPRARRAASWWDETPAPKPPTPAP